MAVTYIGSGSAGIGANPSVTVPTGRISGDLLIIVVVGVIYPSVLTTPTGWSVPAGLAVTGNSIRIFYKISGASEATVTLGGSTVTRAMMHCFRDAYVDQASGAVANAVVIAGNATTITGPRIYQQQNPAYLLQVLGISSAISSSTDSYAQPLLSGGGSSAGIAAGFYLSGYADTSGSYNNTTILSPSPTVTATFSPAAGNLSAFTFALVPAATYSLTRSVASVNEGSSFTITFATNQSGPFPYTITGVSTGDINGASLTGTVTNGTVLTYTVTADLLLEGAETFSIALNNGLASTTVLINDTSFPTYSLTRSVASVNEGSSFTITFATNMSGSFPYTITGVTSADINGASLTGTVTNGTVLTYTVTADSLLEGAETFSIALNNGLASTTVLINDTSNSISIISSANVQKFDSITIAFPLEIDIDPILENFRPLTELVADINSISIAYPLEISTLYAISDWSEKILFNDLEAVSYPLQTSVPVSSVLLPFSNDLEAVAYPLQTSVPVSSVLLPFSNDLEAVSYPVELSVEQKLIDNFSNKTQTYTPISITSPLELSVPVSSLLLPFSNDLEAVSYPLQTSIIHNLINPRINSIGFNDGSIYLDGTTGIDVTEPAGSLYAIGNEFTAELWVRFNDLQGPVGLLAKRANTSTTSAEWITISINSQGFIQLEVSSTSVPFGWALVLTGTQSVGKGIWYHIAVVKSGNNWAIYLNGKQYAFSTSSGTVRSTFGTLSLGAYDTAETYPLNGYVGGVRLVKDLALYTSEFIPPNYEFTNTQTANQDAKPSLAIASGTVLVINPKYGNTIVSDDSGNSAVVTNVYQINHLSPLQLNLNTKFNNAFRTQSITSPFVANISGIGGVTTAASTVTELWI